MEIAGQAKIASRAAADAQQVEIFHIVEKAAKNKSETTDEISRKSKRAPVLEWLRS